MLTMNIPLKDCTIEGKDIIYRMSTAFTKFYLGYKHNVKGYYPPHIEVEGKTIKTFARVGMTGSYDLYICDDWRLLIKYRK